METKLTFRVATYNTHKSRGLDGRTRPERILKVLKEINADVVALQEVVSVPGASREKNQAQYFAEELGLHHTIGQTRKLRGGIYGNVILSRLPVVFSENHNISVAWYEQRGCLRADVKLNERHLLHVFNIHLGVDYFERRRQTRKLIDSEILHNPDLSGFRLILGDFNEWTFGMATHYLRKHFTSIDQPHPSRRVRTFPGFLPVLPLDHIYFERDLELKSFTMHRSRTSLIASDHLPMVADLQFNSHHSK